MTKLILWNVSILPGPLSPCDSRPSGNLQISTNTEAMEPQEHLLVSPEWMMRSR